MIAERDTVFVIAEAGVNHNGSLDRALKMVDVAAEAGADAVKFQTFSARRLVTDTAAQAAYQTRNMGKTVSQRAMLEALELDDDAHRHLLAHCRARGITFLSTPFDVGSLRFLHEDIGVPLMKVGSGDLTNGPLVLAAARTGLPLILSTGMATLDEVAETVALVEFGLREAEGTPSAADLAARSFPVVAESLLARRLTLLLCTTDYPTPPEDVGLRAMSLLGQSFGVPVGFSDHTVGVTASTAAVALGARVVEKHFTLSRDLPGPDHSASLEPDELATLVRAVRDAETMTRGATLTVSAAEADNRLAARKSLVAAHPIAAGEEIAAAAIEIKRPGGGISPMRFWDLAGVKANRAYATDEAFDPCLIA